MSIFNTYDKVCKGITLFRFGQLRVELWFIPAQYSIVEHTHPSEDVELIHIFGRSIFYRRDLRSMEKENAIVGHFSWFKKFSVKHYHSHWFEVCQHPMIFLNIQRFLPGFKPESAAKDFAVLKKEDYGL